MKQEFITWKQKNEFISWKQKLVSWLILLGLLGVLSLVMVSCASTDIARFDSKSKAPVKTVGHQLENTIVSELSSATVGGTTGSAINKQMDKQASELRSRLKGAKIIRFEEGILITIDSRLLFEEDSYTLQSTKGMLKDLARILQKHGYTNAVIEGHTDNVGEEIYNQSLSENRAHEIENYLIGKGINDARMKTRGYGEKQPIAPNDTNAGRQLNRRIEIGLYANDQLRQATSKADETYTALKQ
jgi:outer membrane protein OmpA-like peptidoglycan-associated protein